MISALKSGSAGSGAVLSQPSCPFIRHKSRNAITMLMKECLSLSVARVHAHDQRSILLVIYYLPDTRNDPKATRTLTLVNHYTPTCHCVNGIPEWRDESSRRSSPTLRATAWRPNGPQSGESHTPREQRTPTQRRQQREQGGEASDAAFPQYDQ